MWDAPEPNSRNHNRFARRETTKAARAAEYWASDFDEYALPDSASGGSSLNRGVHVPKSVPGFVSARLSKPGASKSNPTSPKPPLPMLKSANRNFALPVPFSLQNEPPKPETGLRDFANCHNNHLAAMRSIGLPSPSAEGSSVGSPFSPNTSAGGGSPVPPSVGSFQNKSSSSISAWKNLGVPETSAGLGLGLGLGAQTSGAAGGAGRVPMVNGTKRLGMGRPAPWGAKKTRLE